MIQITDDMDGKDATVLAGFPHTLCTCQNGTRIDDNLQTHL